MGNENLLKNKTKLNKFFIVVVKPLLLFLYRYGVFIALFLTYALTMHFLNLNSCLVKWIIGYPCMACGLTRSALALFRFDFVLAFKMNPLIFLLPFILIIFIYKDYGIFKKLAHSKIFWIIIILIILLTYILRMILSYGSEPLTYFENNLIELIKRKLNS